MNRAALAVLFPLLFFW